jgi:alpha-galactosidase
MKSNAFRGLLLGVGAQALLLPLLFSQSPQDQARELGFNRAWAETAFVDFPAATAPGNRIAVVHEETPGDAQKSKSSGGSPLQLGEKFYERGIGVSSRSVLRVGLVKPAERFQADIGVDRFADSMFSSVRFLVEAGGKKIFTSEYMKPSAGARSIDVPLNGATAFDLIVEASLDSHGLNRADWAAARISLQDGSQLWLDDLADHWSAATDLPFSFVLDGQSSREFLNKWKRAVQVEQLDDKKSRRTVTLQDPKTGLEVRAVAIIYRDTAGVDWTLYLTNHGSKDTPIIEKLNALDVTINPGVGTTPILNRIHGSLTTVDDFQPYSDSLKPGQRIEFAPLRGKSSEGTAPFFNLQFGGGGVITSIGWSGAWNAAVERQKDGQLHLQAGLQNLHLKLHPGESIRSPRILQLYWFGNDPVRSYNLFRHTMFSHIMPKIDGKTVVPPIVHLSTSLYEQNDGDQKDVLSHLESIKGLGFEMLWLDAYWTKYGFPEGMGNYGFPLERSEPRDRFPHGLKPVSDAVHKEGMGFLVWFEPERVYEGTFLYKDHPDWVIKPKVVCTNCMIPTQKSFLLNLGIPEAREYMTKFLIAAVKEYGIDCLRFDYNISPDVFWKHLDAADPDRIGMAEIRYVEGLYKMWDDLLQAYPHLFIDNCASGGMRIDLETSARSIPLWRTDGTIDPVSRLDFNQAALLNQVMTAGLSRYVPFSTSGQMGATPYLFRSGFNAGIAFGEDVRSAAYPHELLKQAVAEGKRIRKYFFGDFYPLTEVTASPEDWCVLQYHRAAEQDGMVLAFRRHSSPYENYHAALKEIDAEGKYDVTFYSGYAPAKSFQMTGAELQHLKIEIDEVPGSLLVEYKKTHSGPGQTAQVR